MTAHIFTLPFEMRAHIYSYLHTPTLNLDFCSNLSEERLTNYSSKTKPSPILAYFNRRRVAMQWARNYGLHLTKVHPSLRNEYMDLLKRTKTHVTIHCTKCLDRLLSHLVRDLEIKTPLLKTVWFRIDPHLRGHAHDFEPRFTRILQDFKDVVSKHYGSYDLMWSEGCTIPESRKWLVEKVTLVGRKPIPVKQVVEGEQGDGDSNQLLEQSEDNSDEESNLDWERRSRSYFTCDGVTVLEQRATKWEISAPDCEMAKVLRMVGRGRWGAQGDQWRYSRHTEKEYKDKGKKVKGLVIREELSIGVEMK